MTGYAVRIASPSSETGARVLRAGAADPMTAANMALDLVSLDARALIAVTLDRAPRIPQTLASVTSEVSNRFEFTSRTGTLSASRSLVRPGHWGKLPRAYVSPYLRAHMQEISPYVVWSYGTPIAWTAGTDLVVPLVEYSETTTRHQRLVAQATGARPVLLS